MGQQPVVCESSCNARKLLLPLPLPLLERRSQSDHAFLVIAHQHTARHSSMDMRNLISLFSGKHGFVSFTALALTLASGRDQRRQHVLGIVIALVDSRTCHRQHGVLDGFVGTAVRRGAGLRCGVACRIQRQLTPDTAPTPPTSAPQPRGTCSTRCRVCASGRSAGSDARKPSW